MKKYMLVYLVGEEQSVKFADTESEARDAKTNIECGLGSYCEVDVRTVDGYKFLYA